MTRSLVVDAAITVRPGFPSDGLERMRTAVISRVAQYDIGEQVWSNDILSALETIPGTRVTALTVQEGSRDISGVDVPLDALWDLPLANFTIILSGI